MQNFYFLPKIAQLCFMCHLEPPHWLSWCSISKYAIWYKICNILIFHPKRPNFDLKITESPRISSFVISVLSTKICKIPKILIFQPQWPSFVLSITKSLRTSAFDISVFWTKICKFKRNIQKNPFFTQNSPIRFLALWVTFNLSKDYIGVLDHNLIVI